MELDGFHKHTFVPSFHPNTLLSIYGLVYEDLHLNTINGWIMDGEIEGGTETDEDRTVADSGAGGLAQYWVTINHWSPSWS